MSWLDGLNDDQRAAALHDGTHLFIVAGPGTGKTRTLTCRIARLAQTLKPGQKILAVTFTNKAAEEMQKRLEALGVDLGGCVDAGTVHAFSLRLLREYHDRLPFLLNFSIATPDEVEALAAEFLPEASRRERRAFLKDVAAWKATLEAESDDERVRGFRDFMRERGLVDFDDILRDAVLLLRDNPDIARDVRRRYPFVLVDEYQDVNAMQVALLKLLVGEGPLPVPPHEGEGRSSPLPLWEGPGEGKSSAQLTVIGDPNQAIYGFRGSDVRFFEEFEKTFAPCHRVELGENYRSAGNLLGASGQVIRAGARFPVPELTARIHTNGFLGIHEAASEKAEADFVAREIMKLVGGLGHHDQDIDGARGGEGYSFSDIAVLFRLNVQARALEESLMKSGIPFQTAGVKPAGLSLSTRQALRDIHDMARLFAELERLRGSDEALSTNWESMSELAANSRSVADFLDRTSLSVPEDAYVAKAEKVALLTLHAAKGLEFPVIFIVGCEEGLLPLDVDFLETYPEEERRLFYVGMTRARERLYFTRTKRRVLFGRILEQAESTFLRDIREEMEPFQGKTLSRKFIQEREQMKLF